MAPKTFSGIFSVPELNRALGEFLGDGEEGLQHQALLCRCNRSLAGRNGVRLWCLNNLWRWQWHPWRYAGCVSVSSTGFAAAENPYEVPIDPREEFPYGW